MTGSVSLSALAVILALGSSRPAQPQPSRPAMPIEPISAIVQQFKSHTLVALGDNEASVQGSESPYKACPRSALYRCRKRHCCGIRRFLVSGPGRSIHAWRGSPTRIAAACMAGYDSGRVHLGSADLRGVTPSCSDVNSSLPGSRKLRVLLGDPPIEWEKIIRWTI